MFDVGARTFSVVTVPAYWGRGTAAISPPSSPWCIEEQRLGCVGLCPQHFEAGLRGCSWLWVAVKWTWRQVSEPASAETYLLKAGTQAPACTEQLQRLEGGGQRARRLFSVLSRTSPATLARRRPRTWEPGNWRSTRRRLLSWRWTVPSNCLSPESKREGGREWTEDVCVCICVRRRAAGGKVVTRRFKSKQIRDG